MYAREFGSDVPNDSLWWLHVCTYWFYARHSTHFHKSLLMGVSWTISDVFIATFDFLYMKKSSLLHGQLAASFNLSDSSSCICSSGSHFGCYISMMLEYINIIWLVFMKFFSCRSQKGFEWKQHTQDDFFNVIFNHLYFLFRLLSSPLHRICYFLTIHLFVWEQLKQSSWSCNTLKASKGAAQIYNAEIWFQPLLHHN